VPICNFSCWREKAIFEEHLRTNTIAHVHAANIVHRDITLQNIIVCAGVGRTSIQWHDNCTKLIDFGLSCRVKPGALMDTYCGNPAYASPEVLQQTPHDGFAADIWSIGVVLYCMLMGKMPFSSGKDILNAEVDCSIIYIDGQCVDLLGKILTKESNQRARVSQIVSHPWLTEHSEWVRSFASSRAMVIDEQDKFATPTKRVRMDCPSLSVEDLRSNVVQ
jgi:serine/threonine protein kinase